MLPEAPLAWQDAWFGALFTALLFSLGKYGIGEIYAEQFLVELPDEHRDFRRLTAHTETGKVAYVAYDRDDKLRAPFRIPEFPDHFF